MNDETTLEPNQRVEPPVNVNSTLESSNDSQTEKSQTHRFLRVTIAIVILLFTGATLTLAYLNQNLILKALFPSRTVTLDIPREYQASVKRVCEGRGFGGTFITDFTVNWGDGQTSNCPEHTYLRPGTYKVVAELYRSSDIPEFDGEYTQYTTIKHGIIEVK